MNNPKISIILPTHNRSEILPRTVNSLLSQSFHDFEIIIVDDASHDNTPAVIEEMVKLDGRIWSIRSEKNIGPGAARNLGVKNALGEFIAIMDDDDLALPNRLDMQYQAFFKQPEVDFVFSAIEWFDDQGKIFHKSPGIVVRDNFPDNPKDVFKPIYLGGGGIPNQTIMTRKTLWSKFEYPECPWIGEDWIYFLKLSASGVRMKAIPEPLVKVYKGAQKQSLTANLREKVYPEYKKAYFIIRNWLRENGFHEFETFHQKALSNLYLRESRYYLGWRAYGYIGKAFLTAPNNPEVLKQFKTHVKNGYDYIRKKIEHKNIQKK